jgi:predicted lactoylglutathione lyase
MFGSLFGSKNKKLAIRWEKEHQEMVLLAHEVITHYTKNNMSDAKKSLKALNSLTVDHLMEEDIEFYKLLKDDKRLTPKTVDLVHEFTRTFKDTKLTLMKFLTTYSKDDAVLDEAFFNTFNTLVEVLANRINFEEENLYTLLKEK